MACRESECLSGFIAEEIVERSARRWEWVNGRSTDTECPKRCRRTYPLVLHTASKVKANASDAFPEELSRDPISEGVPPRLREVFMRDLCPIDKDINPLPSSKGIDERVEDLLSFLMTEDGDPEVRAEFRREK